MKIKVTNLHIVVKSVVMDYILLRGTLDGLYEQK